MTKCKDCNCDCHCTKKEHGDIYGACPCKNCDCKKPESVVVDETNECESCQ